MIDYDVLKNWPFDDIEHCYDIDDSMLYALSVGVGADPLDPAQLRFTHEMRQHGPAALPTMATIVGYPGGWLADPRTGVDFSKTVHGSEGVTLHQSMPAAATVVARHHVSHVVDKGAGRGALVVYEKELFDKPTGHKLATVTHTSFCRADGGFSLGSGQTDEPPVLERKMPQSAPERIWEYRTLPQQALLYRLCADRNALHCDPEVARAAGFARPLLHGLCTFGIAGQAILATWCDFDPAAMQSLSARFSAPLFPGETLRLEMVRSGAEVLFRAFAKERGALVLDAGCALLAPQ